MNSKIRRLPPRSHLHGMICLAGHHRKSILFPGQLAICRPPQSALVHAKGCPDQRCHGQPRNLPLAVNARLARRPRAFRRG